MFGIVSKSKSIPSIQACYIVVHLMLCDCLRKEDCYSVSLKYSLILHSGQILLDKQTTAFMTTLLIAKSNFETCLLQRRLEASECACDKTTNIHRTIM